MKEYAYNFLLTSAQQNAVVDSIMEFHVASHSLNIRLSPIPDKNTVYRVGAQYDPYTANISDLSCNLPIILEPQMIFTYLGLGHHLFTTQYQTCFCNQFFQ
jgi:hypothetical protein